MAKWETINELDVEDPENMMEFSAEYLTWTNVGGTKSQLFHILDLRTL